MAVQVFGSCREAGGVAGGGHGGPQMVLASCWGNGVRTPGLRGQGLWQTLTFLPQGHCTAFLAPQRKPRASQSMQ